MHDRCQRKNPIHYPDGTQEAAYRYDLWGNCVQKSDEKGYITYLTYDLAGRLIRELAPIGDGTEDKEEVSYRMTTYSYDNNGNRTGEIRHGGSYDKDGNLLTTGEDLALTFRYDARNRLAGVEDSMGASVTYRYDARGNRVSEEQSINSGDHEACRKVLRKIRYSYDKAGRMVQKKEILDDGLEGTAAQTFTTAVTGYTYDENGNIIHITTPEGCQISRTYDCMDRLLEECLEDKANGISRTTYLTYDKAGNITNVRQAGQDGKERKLFYAYDLQDRLTYAGEQDGLRINLSYDKNGRRIEQRQLLPAEEESYAATSFLYDIRGNLTERYRNGLLEERNQYDIRGNRTSAIDGDGIEASHSYGIQDERLETFTANSRKQGRAAQKLTYDARGRITGVEDGCGGQTSYSLDGWGRITGIHTPEGGQEQYAYDQAGNITKTVDAKGGIIRYAYNSQGKVCSITDQSGSTETFRYDREGRQIQHTDRKGTVTDTKYNIYGQPVLQACTDKKGRRHVMGTWEYDDFGNLKKAVSGGFCYTYDYRPDGKLLRKRNSGKLVISCAYYQDGSLKSLTDVSGKTLYYGYDGTGRLANLKDEDGTTLTEYEYTTAGRIKEIRTSDGAAASYTYDSDGNISRLRIENTERNEILYDSFMLYDLNGNRISKAGQQLGADRKIKELHTAYRYDTMNRLTEESRKTEGEKYAYDLCGNRLTKESYRDGLIDGTESYSYNERNELTERNILSVATKYLYDENGNLVSEKEGERETSYRYDLLNRQTHAITKDGWEQENLYDGEGLRAGIKENGKVTSFLYYNGEILAECDGDSAPVRRHLAGQGLSHVEDISTGLTHTYHQDEQGSTAYITGGNGTVENCYLYDAFGNIRESHEDIKNRILYTGQQYDQETGQYYLRARYYNPVIGRFTQEDTYRGDGLNLYAYCANNPVMYYDPSGHENECNGGNTEQKEPPETLAEQVGSESCTIPKENTTSQVPGNNAVPTQEQMHESVTQWARMEENLADSNRQRNKFNTATVVYDAGNDNYYYGMNRGVQLSGDDVNTTLSSWLPSESLNEYRLGNCAEVDAVNQALNSGANVSDLYMYTINTKTNLPKPMCENCIYTFSDKVAGVFSN